MLLAGFHTQTIRLDQVFRPCEHLASKDVMHAFRASETSAPFGSVDGGTLLIDQWRDQPELVVNTSSQCAFIRLIDGILTND